MASGDARIAEEFTRLLDKSKQLFNGLRELPPHGHKHWQAYFGRTFDVYTKLWKFQQQYSLRTSETNYLFESFAFYAAIRQRQYYSDIESERRADLVVKKLRYYARFIVVCLLLNRTKLLDELLTEFAAEIDKFAKSYGPDEQLEWSLVIDELRAFLRADRCVEVVDSTGHLVPLVHRLTPFSASAPAPPLSLTTSSLPSMKNSTTTLKQQQQQQNPFGTFTFPGVRQHLRLQEAVIVGASHAQPRFSELTIDAYRLAQAIERQPDDILVAASASARIYDSSPVPIRRQGAPTATSGAGVTLLSSQLGGPGPGGVASSISPSTSLGMTGPGRRENPHKYLIYRPTFAQLFNCISAAHRDVSSNGVLLVYLSSDAAGGLPASPQTEQRPFSPGTWALNESGHFGMGTLENTTHRQQKPHIMDIMMSSSIQVSQGGDDADFMCGVPTEASENAHRTCVLSDDHLAVEVQNQHEDGYNADYGNLRGERSVMAGSGSAESESRRRKRLKHQQQVRSKPDLSVSPSALQTSGKDRNCLYPGDLYPFLRKPLMLIIDSENSSAFSHFPCLFGQPLVALLSPPCLPAPLAARRRDSGGLFTLFLHSPLAAFCFVCGVRSMPVALWDRCQAIVHKFLLATCRLFLSPPADDIDPSYVAMFSDDFLRSLVLRFVFCHYVLSCHVTTTTPKLATSKRSNDNEEECSPLMPVVVSPQYLPLACPQLPRNRILSNAQLFSIVADLAATLSILDQFPCLAALGPQFHGHQSSAFAAISTLGDDYTSPIYQNVNQQPPPPPPPQQQQASQEPLTSFFAAKQHRSSGGKHHQRASSASRTARPSSSSQISPPARHSPPMPPALPSRSGNTKHCSSKGANKLSHRDEAAGPAS